MTEQHDPRRLGWAHTLARLALLAAAGAATVLLLLIGKGGVLLVIGGLLGLALTAAGTWWSLAHRGVHRWIGALVVVLALAGVVAGYANAGIWLPALGAVALWAVALALARAGLREARPRHRMRTYPAARPRRAVLIMNPRSGGGKVERFDLVARARRLGAEVILLDTTRQTDVGALARRAVAEGADLLGVAGGDGTQALVAAVAAEHALPFLVISAGTRNHFAMDLGLDRDDPSRCLDALTDGEELRVDLGTVSGRPFVNTVSFGAYAEIVQSPEYRDAKLGTALEALPDLLLANPDRRLLARADQARLDGQQALLVSNNAYSGADPLTAGRRERLDAGVLGVLGIRVDGPAQAAEIALLGARAPGLRKLTAREVVVTGTADDGADIAVAVDGEALRLPPPVICAIRPGALRVLVPVHRPGAPRTSGPLDWRSLGALALGRPLPEAAAAPGGSDEAPGGSDPAAGGSDAR